MLVSAGATLSTGSLSRVTAQADRDRWLGMEGDAAGIARAGETIQRAGFVAMRERALEVCIALQDLDMDAWRMCRILAKISVFGEHIQIGKVWQLAVTVKHFKARRAVDEQIA